MDAVLEAGNRCKDQLNRRGHIASGRVDRQVTAIPGVIVPADTVRITIAGMIAEGYGNAVNEKREGA
jgi:hypothetical protein